MHAAVCCMCVFISQLLFCPRTYISRSSKVMSSSEGGRGFRFEENRTFDSISGSISTAPVCRSERATTSTSTRGQHRNGQGNLQSYSTSLIDKSEDRNAAPFTRMSTAGAISGLVTGMRGEIGSKPRIPQLDKGYFSTTRSSTREVSLQGVSWFLFAVFQDKVNQIFFLCVWGFNLLVNKFVHAFQNSTLDSNGTSVSQSPLTRTTSPSSEQSSAVTKSTFEQSTSSTERWGVYTC